MGLAHPMPCQKCQCYSACSATPRQTQTFPGCPALIPSLSHLAPRPPAGVHNGRQLICCCSRGLPAAPLGWPHLPRQPPCQLVLPAQDGGVRHRGRCSWGGVGMRREGLRDWQRRLRSKDRNTGISQCPDNLTLSFDVCLALPAHCRSTTWMCPAA